MKLQASAATRQLAIEALERSERQIITAGIKNTGTPSYVLRAHNRRIIKKLKESN